MNEMMLLAQLAINVAAILYLNRMVSEYREEITEIHEAYREERKELLDRIMANNITEFKTARQETDVKRSGSGNFLLDRMTKHAPHGDE
jgi:hypothetical protein